MTRPRYGSSCMPRSSTRPRCVRRPMPCRSSPRTISHTSDPARTAEVRRAAPWRSFSPLGYVGCFANHPHYLHANVLPHLSSPCVGQSSTCGLPRPPRGKMAYLAHMVGILLNHMFDPASRRSHYHDKDFMPLPAACCIDHAVGGLPGNKRIEVCGTLLGQRPPRAADSRAVCPAAR